MSSMTDRENRDFERRLLEDDPVGPVWCPVATMRAERPYGPGGQETKLGSRHFAPGAKTYCIHVMGTRPEPQIEVVGRHRASHRYVTMVVRASWLTNWRVELVYSPRVITDLWPIWGGTPASRAKAEQWVREFGSPPPPSAETSSPPA
jgi:hypothetical protein